MRSFKRHSGLLLSALFLASSAAYAEDGKVYSGQQCVPSSSTAAFAIGSNGGLYNPGSGTLTVFCPFVKDDVDGMIVNYRVTVEDRNTTSAVTCQLISRTASSQITGATKSSNAANSQVVTLSADGQTTLSGGAMFLKCALPRVDAGQSGIIFYSINETGY